MMSVLASQYIQPADRHAFYVPGMFVQIAYIGDITFNVPTRWRVVSISIGGAFLSLARQVQTPRAQRVRTIYRVYDLDTEAQTQEVLRVDPDQTPETVGLLDVGPLFAKQ